MRNYLTRLGWAHGDDEFFTSAQAMAWFDLAGIGRAPARLDFKKLENISGQHIAATDNAALLHELEAFLVATGQAALTKRQRDLMSRGLYCVKDRAKTFVELLDKALFMLIERPVVSDESAAKSLDAVSRGILQDLTPRLQTAQWTKEAIEVILTDVATAHGIGFGKLAAPLRAALAGRTVTPSVYDMMLVIGQDETISRIGDAAA
jgi:glutamyl-tRNA synthetase